MKTFAFIPARYGSSRFPGKPLALIAKKPMIQHVYERTVSCPDVYQVYVATDDERIRDCVTGFGGNALITDSSHRSGTDRICEAARKIGLDKDDIVVNVQGDQPLFNNALVSQLIAPLMEERNVPISTLKWRIEREEDIHNPNHVKVITDTQGFAIYFSRHAIPYVRNGERKHDFFKHLGVYAYRMDFLATFTNLPQGILETAEKLEQLRALEHGFKIKVVETEYNSIEVDIPEDIEKVESILKG
ncbi:3-deoxy-manno-octulosonate cytidylyltransferase [Thermodesulfobacteriota bacterium]